VYSQGEKNTLFSNTLSLRSSLNVSDQVSHYNLNKQNHVQESEDVKQTLQLILDKLNKQEALFTIFDEGIKKLEYSAQRTTPKTKQK